MCAELVPVTAVEVKGPISLWHCSVPPVLPDLHGLVVLSVDEGEWSGAGAGFILVWK